MDAALVMLQLDELVLVSSIQAGDVQVWLLAGISFPLKHDAVLSCDGAAPGAAAACCMGVLAHGMSSSTQVTLASVSVKGLTFRVHGLALEWKWHFRLGTLAWCAVEARCLLPRACLLRHEARVRVQGLPPDGVLVGEVCC